MILIIDRIVNKVIRLYRTKVFIAKVGKKNVGKVKIKGLINMWASNMKLGNNVSIFPNVTFWGDGEIVIGNNVNIGNNTIIYSSKKGGVYIGNDVSIAANCYIIDSDHGTRKDILIRDQENISTKIIIKDDVWIADNCTILRGSIINNGAVLGAKSLVKGTIDSNSVAVGIPAKTLRVRE